MYYIYQICFMNESPGDTDSEGRSPRQHDLHDNIKMVTKDDDLVDSDVSKVKGQHW